MATNCDNDLNFRGGNPGAVQYGNFINYYQFHSPKDRIDSLPTDVWIKHDPFVVLDVGCNAGDLTIALYDFISSNISKNCYILGIDIDPVLVQRANENNINSNIKFICLDFMNIKDRNCVVSNYLESVSATRFSACFCFSITMWIHLNHGDIGLKNFLKDVCVISDMVIIEPQPWKCYKSAVKRMKSYNYEFLQYNNLKIRNKVEEEIENIFMQINGVSKVKETGNSSWGRKISVFKVSQ
ncbi:hypothetical protein RN001_007865 [Aquatica leii]|uniref:RNA methyltransferase n=1 Tax=Aquatica leii TaxID=1421715 RepID=A0AAN7SH06_9COLE|nr:hypothetical protein RN001_007865 [Aquatica leii]